MKCAVLILYAMLLFPMLADAGDLVTPGAGGAAFIIKDGQTVAVGEMFVEANYQFAWTEKWWGEMAVLAGQQATDAPVFGGVGIRAYNQTGDVFPGFGIAFFGLDSPLLTQTTVFGGFEALLEVPVSTTYDEDGAEVVGDKVTAFAGIYRGLTGDTKANVVRFGAKLALN